jgi:LysR family glycine cleavage system transcriptional activator
VCSPSPLDKLPLRRPPDLRNHTLIHLDWQAQHDTWPDWRMWLLAAGVAGVDLDRGIHFSQTTFVLQAALEGQGVALGNTSLVKDDLAAGRLVQPLKLSLPIAPDFAYYLIIPKRKAELPVVTAFRAWALSEVAGPQ